MIQLFKTRVKPTNISQPDAVTCQATCIAMALGLPSDQVMRIRAELVAIGTAGSPGVMGKVLLKYLPPERYQFDFDASLHDCYEWLKAGEFLITHGWFTGSGHVICLDEVALDMTRMAMRFSVKDPWGEFDFPRWRYLPGATFFDGFYSAVGIFAACVAGQSPDHAFQQYRAKRINTKQGGMWVHRIKPK